jgi:hypothetical protein
MSPHRPNIITAERVREILFAHGFKAAESQRGYLKHGGKPFWSEGFRVTQQDWDAVTVWRMGTIGSNQSPEALADLDRYALTLRAFGFKSILGSIGQLTVFPERGARGRLPLPGERSW